MYIYIFFFREKTESASKDFQDNHSENCHTLSVQTQEPKIQLNNNNNDINITRQKTKKTFKNALPQVS